MADNSKNGKSLEINYILDSIDRELSFYRERVYSIYKSVVLLQIILITGQQTITLSNPLLEKIVYSIVFIALVAITSVFSSSYKQRIYKLRNAKISLVAKVGISNAFPKTGGPKTVSPSKMYLLTIILVAVLGLLITWLG